MVLVLQFLDTMSQYCSFQTSLRHMIRVGFIAEHPPFCDMCNYIFYKKILNVISKYYISILMMFNIKVYYRHNNTAIISKYI